MSGTARRPLHPWAQARARQPHRPHGRARGRRARVPCGGLEPRPRWRTQRPRIAVEHGSRAEAAVGPGRLTRPSCTNVDDADPIGNCIDFGEVSEERKTVVSSRATWLTSSWRTSRPPRIGFRSVRSRLWQLGAARRTRAAASLVRLARALPRSRRPEASRLEQHRLEVGAPPRITRRRRRRSHRRSCRCRDPSPLAGRKVQRRLPADEREASVAVGGVAASSARRRISTTA